MMPFIAHPLHLVLGLIIWGLWFVLMYSILSISCAAYPQPYASLSWINGALLGLSLLTLFILMYFAYGCWRLREDSRLKKVSRFVVWLSLGGYLAAMAATFSMGMMVLFFPACL